MSVQHTPGPWSVNDDMDIVAGDRRPVAQTFFDQTHSFRKYAENEANARLIAAAPDYDRAARLALRLLEADRSIFFNCHTVAGNPASLSANEACVIAAYDAAINGLKAAIAKAEGRDQ